MSLGRNIKVIRAKAGMSSSEVATQLHLSPQAYGKIERGETALTVERLNQLATIFGVSKQYIEEFDVDDNSMIFAHTATDYHSIVVTQFNEVHEKLIDTLSSQLAAKDAQILFLQAHIGNLMA